MSDRSAAEVTRDLRILHAVYHGAEGACEVAERTGISLSAVVHCARRLVDEGYLLALDGAPWAVPVRPTVQLLLGARFGQWEVLWPLRDRRGELVSQITGEPR